MFQIKFKEKIQNHHRITLVDPVLFMLDLFNANMFLSLNCITKEGRKGCVKGFVILVLELTIH